MVNCEPVIGDTCLRGGTQCMGTFRLRQRRLSEGRKLSPCQNDRSTVLSLSFHARHRFSGIRPTLVFPWTTTKIFIPPAGTLPVHSHFPCATHKVARRIFLGPGGSILKIKWLISVGLERLTKARPFL